MECFVEDFYEAVTDAGDDEHSVPEVSSDAGAEDAEAGGVGVFLLVWPEGPICFFLVGA